MSVRHPFRTALVAATAAGALVLSACGSSTENEASSVAGDISASADAAVSSASEAVETAVSDLESVASGATESASSATAEAGAAIDIEAAKASLIADGKLTTCTHLSYAPFQFNDDDGNTIGFDVDIVNLVATKLGVEQVIVDTPFEGIKSGQDTAAGKCDISAAAMSITPEREAVILFSDPYFDATQALLVNESADIADLAGLSGKKIGAQAATVGLDYATAEAAANGYEIIEYPDLNSQIQALVTGQIDGAINDLPVFGDFVKNQPGKAKIVAQFDTGDQYGLGMKLGNDALKGVVDSVLAEAKADGTYDEIFATWIAEVPAS